MLAGSFEKLLFLWFPTAPVVDVVYPQYGEQDIWQLGVWGSYHFLCNGSGSVQVMIWMISHLRSKSVQFGCETELNYMRQFHLPWNSIKPAFAYYDNLSITQLSFEDDTRYGWMGLLEAKSMKSPCYKFLKLYVLFFRGLFIIIFYRIFSYFILM